MLVTSIFFFSYNVFKRIFPPVRQKSSLCGNGLNYLLQVLIAAFFQVFCLCFVRAQDGLYKLNTWMETWYVQE